MSQNATDVIVIGAGPAGVTTATVLKLRRPETRVVLLEAAQFPRHKIGESLLVDTNAVLARMGALDAVEAAGFSKKLGATFVWGEDRSVYTFLWRDGEREVLGGESVPLGYTWHVDRAEYDSLLLDRAREVGVDVREGATVYEVLIEDSVVVGVQLEGGECLRARYTVDCGGGRGPLCRGRGAGPGARRVLDADLRNIAVYTYLRGLRFDDELNGAEDARRTLILTHPEGWFWVIPLKDGLASVGFVTTLSHYKTKDSSDPGALFDRELKRLPEFDRLFGEVERVDYRGDGELVHVVQDYSYVADHLYGDGWAVCGDAAGFVDAILSIGCYVAHAHGEFLACALGSVLDGEVSHAEALACYETSVRENLAGFRAVAHMFYAFGGSMSDWWRRCSEELRRSTLVPEASDQTAFLAFFTGFSARCANYDQAVTALGGSFLHEVSDDLWSDEARFREGLAAEAERARAIIASDPRLVLTEGVRVEPFWLPDVNAGRLRRVARVLLPSGDDSASVARRLYVAESMAAAPSRLTGNLRLSELASGLADELGGDAKIFRRELMKLGYRMLAMGLAQRADPS